MTRRAQMAIARKDMREIMMNKTAKAAMILVPLIMTLAMPCIFTAIAYFAPDEMDDFSYMIRLLPIKFALSDMMRAGYYYVMNYFMPTFFVLIPIMAASVAASSSFVGEKERRTLETLLFSPLTVRQIFFAKVMGALFASFIVTGVSFAGYLVVAAIGSAMLYGSFVLELSIWAVVVLLISPAVSLLGVTAIVLASARARSFQEAQQYGAMLIAPVMIFMLVPQSVGLFVLDAPRLALLGLISLAVALVLTRLAAARFTPEKLLK